VLAGAHNLFGDVVLSDEHAACVIVREMRSIFVGSPLFGLDWWRLLIVMDNMVIIVVVALLHDHSYPNQNPKDSKTVLVPLYGHMNEFTLDTIFCRGSN